MSSISENMKSACYNLSGRGGRGGRVTYPNMRTADALVRRGLARWVEPGKVVLVLTGDGLKVATAYNDKLLQIGHEVQS